MIQKHAHAIYRDFVNLKIETFQLKKIDIFLFFAQNIDCGYTLEPPRLTSTHNLCFGAKIRKIGIPLHTPVLLYKRGVQRGINYKDVFMMADLSLHWPHLTFCFVAQWLLYLYDFIVQNCVYMTFKLK